MTESAKSSELMPQTKEPRCAQCGEPLKPTRTGDTRRQRTVCVDCAFDLPCTD